MNQLCVSGYASMDYVLDLERPMSADQTSRASRAPDAWPHIGGCTSYIAMAAHHLDCVATPITWVGDDALGADYVSALRASGVSTHGVCQIKDASSPTAMMMYQPDGSCICVYDPGLAGQETLSREQQAAIASASHLRISVGPPHLTQQIIALRAPGARLYWAVKDDPACFTPAVCDALSTAADVIFCSQAERGMIGKTDAVIVQTMGASGVKITDGAHSDTLSVTKIDAHNTTGAGDSFAGGFIAAEMTQASPPEQAAHSGIAAAHRVLLRRQRGNA